MNHQEKSQPSKIILVCGARPNFMKVAPLIRAIEKHNASSNGNTIEPLLVHTGQHYDYNMSKIFFENLELPEPDIHLGIGSGTQAWQTGKIMIEFEKVLFREKADIVIVVGDTNSTLAASLAVAKLHTPIAHVEAGLRSYDKSMPEEVNRVLTDAIADYLFTPSPDANENLMGEGILEKKIFLVGNVMIDSLLYGKGKAQESCILSQLGLTERNYAVLTLHRPHNVDNEISLKRIAKTLDTISQRIPIVFPCHPRTRKNIERFKLGHLFQHVNTKDAKPSTSTSRIFLTEPLSYLNFLKLMMSATLVMTDSGGIQEETTAMDIPCLTLRNTTERPITVTQGTNTLVGSDSARVIEEAFRILDGKGKKGNCPDLWDGKAAERIVEILSTTKELS